MIFAHNQSESTINNQPILVARDWLIVVILLLVMTVVWIGFEVYKTLTVVDIPQPLRSLTEPVKTDIDRSILEKLSQRQQLRHQDLSETTRVRLETPGGSSQPASPSVVP